MGKENIKQQLSETKLEQLNKQPIIETSVIMSEDKKWIVHKTNHNQHQANKLHGKSA